MTTTISKKKQINEKQAIAISRLIARKDKPITEITKELASLVDGGLTRQTIYNWKRGEPILEQHIPALCKYFKTTPEELRYNKVVLSDADKTEIITLVRELTHEYASNISYRREAEIIVSVMQSYQEYKATIGPSSSLADFKALATSIIKSMLAQKKPLLRGLS